MNYLCSKPRFKGPGGILTYHTLLHDQSFLIGSFQIARFKFVCNHYHIIALSIIILYQSHGLR